MQPANAVGMSCPHEEVVDLKLQQNKSHCDGETTEERGANETGDYMNACDQNTLLGSINSVVSSTANPHV